MRPESAHSISAELFNIPLGDGKFLVYAPLRRVAFVSNAKTVNFLCDLQSGSIDFSSADQDNGLIAFLRSLKIVDGGEECRPSSIYHGDPRPTAVTLFLTTACNLRCSYCYAAAGDKPARFMSLDVAKRGIDFVSSNAIEKSAPSFQVAYHGGGEPTVHWTVLTESFQYAQKRAERFGLQMQATATTNGVLPDERIDWIIQNLTFITLSCDGLPAIHDKNRLTVLGQGSSPQVMHTLKRFEAAGLNYGIRLTVTPDKIDSLAESVEFLCSCTLNARIQVEPAYQIGRWRGGPPTEASAFVAAFRNGQKRAANYGREIYYSAARVGLLSSHFCGVTQDTFALSPDGNVSACYEVFSEEDPRAKIFFYGAPTSDSASMGYNFDLPILNNLRKQTVHNREYCQGCFAKWSCSGDCYHKVLGASENGEFQGSDRCHITRELTKDQILKKIAADGGWFWQEEKTEGEHFNSEGGDSCEAIQA